MHVQACRVVGLIVLAASARAEHVLDDFEAPQSAARWQAAQAPRPDCRPALVAPETGDAGSGQGALRVVFPRQVPALPPYVVLEASTENGLLGQSDWTAFTVFEFEIRVEGPAPVDVDVGVGNAQRQKRYRHRLSVAGGWQLVSIDLSAVAESGVDLGQIAVVGWYQTRPAEDRVLWLDHLRLRDDRAERAAALDSALACAASALGRFPAPETVAALGGRLAEARERLVSAEPGQLEPMRSQVQALLREQQAALAADVVDLAEKLDLPSSPAVRVRPLARLDGATAAQGGTGAALLRDLVAREAARRATWRRLAAARPAKTYALASMSCLDDRQIIRDAAVDAEPADPIRIDAAANECEPLCVLVVPIEHDLAGVAARATPLVGDCGQIGAERLKLAWVQYQQPDPDQPPYARLLRPDLAAVEVPVGAAQALWVDVHVPEDASPGVYRGAVHVEPANAAAQQIELQLRVRAFAIPTVPTLPLVTHSNAAGSPADDAELIGHRVQNGAIYQWPAPPDLAAIRRWVGGGSRLVNLLRVDRTHGQFERDEQGGILRFPDAIRQRYIERLRPRVQEVKQAGLFPYCYVFGFDEPTAAMVPALEDMYGLIKQEFGLPTMFCTYLPLWEEYPVIRHVDYYCVTWQWLTPQRISAVHAQGSKAFAYNLASSGPLARSQVWSAFKSGLDGLLHYNMRDFRVPDQRDEVNHNTVGFQILREGMEDYEYLAILRDRADRLVAAEGPEGPHRFMLVEARRWLAVPDDVAPPAAEWDRESGRPRAILEARRLVGDLIEQLGSAGN